MLLAAVYLVFAFQRCPDADITGEASSSLASADETSRKRTHEDGDGSSVESLVKQRRSDNT